MHGCDVFFYCNSVLMTLFEHIGASNRTFGTTPMFEIIGYFRRKNIEVSILSTWLDVVKILLISILLLSFTPKMSLNLY